MKKNLLRLIIILFLLTCSWGNYKTFGLALAGYDTWEELREAAREVGISVSQGGTYDEYSTCPGEITPNSNTSSSTTDTQQTEAKSVETPKQPVHEHSYIETLTKEPTCIEQGEKTFTCSCGDKYTEPIETVKHTYSKEMVTQEATCTISGKKLISCTVCNDTYEEDIEPLGHEKGEWVISKTATCTDKGEEVVSCKRCGETLETRETELLGHMEGEWKTTQKATLFNEGLNELKCATCGEVLNTEVIPINMNTWYIIIGVCLVGIGTVMVCVVKKKRKK